ncbi:DUF4157 domain-containing protein [Streptomyces vinaceus]|uniref:eCIS core domain-containing protein n=1 Tax=Streptomyces vinaceus TaxID=1960 RepID=UPI0037F807CB
MIWPFRRPRHQDPPSQAQAVTQPAEGAEAGPVRPAWTSAAPLRATGASAPLLSGAGLAHRGSMAVTGRTGSVAAPDAGAPTGRAGGLVTAVTVPATRRASAAEPPELGHSPLPPAAPARRAAATGSPLPGHGPLTRATGAYVGAPRPAADPEHVPEWLSGLMPGVQTPLDPLALMMFPGTLPSEPPRAAPVARPVVEPGSRPPARPTLGQSRRMGLGRPLDGPLSDAAPDPAAPTGDPAGDPARGPRPGEQDSAPLPPPLLAPLAGLRPLLRHGSDAAGTPAEPSGAPFPRVSPSGTDFPAPASPTTQPDGAAAGGPLEHPAVPRGARGGGGAAADSTAGPAPPPGVESVPTDVVQAFTHLHGADVSGVPVVRTPQASSEAAQRSARAFTRNGQVFLPAEHGSLDSPQARGLLAHELTHAVQQRRYGRTLPAENTPAGRRLEFEAVEAERWFRGDPGASDPLVHPAPPLPSCSHTGEEDSAGGAGFPLEASWTPATGMVVDGVQRATEDQIRDEFYRELNEVRAKFQKPSVAGDSELSEEELERLRIRLRKASDDEGGGSEDDPDGEMTPGDEAGALWLRAVDTFTSPFFTLSKKQREAQFESVKNEYNERFPEPSFPELLEPPGPPAAAAGVAGAAEAGTSGAAGAPCCPCVTAAKAGAASSGGAVPAAAGTKAGPSAPKAAPATKETEQEEDTDVPMSELMGSGFLKFADGLLSPIMQLSPKQRERSMDYVQGAWQERFGRETGPELLDLPERPLPAAPPPAAPAAAAAAPAPATAAAGPQASAVSAADAGRALVKELDDSTLALLSDRIYPRVYDRLRNEYVIGIERHGTSPY